METPADFGRASLAEVCLFAAILSLSKTSLACWCTLLCWPSEVLDGALVQELVGLGGPQIPTLSCFTVSVWRRVSSDRREVNAKREAKVPLTLVGLG